MSPFSSWRGALAVYGERRLLLVLLMGFASGLPLALSGSTLAIWLTESGISLTAIGLFSLAAIPYSLKFLWAPLIDRVELPWLTRRLGRRRSWMILIQTSLIAAIAGLGLTQPAATPMITALMAAAVAFFSASQDIVIDAYRIDILDADQQGAGAAMTQAGYRLGMVASGAGALYLASSTSWASTYAIMAAGMLVGLTAAVIAPIPPTDRRAPRPSAAWTVWLYHTVVAPFAEFFQRSSLRLALLLLAFILLYKFGDAFAHVMANPFYIQIGFSKVQIGHVTKVFGMMATLVGVFLGGSIVKRYGILPSLVFGGVVQMLSNLMFSLQALVGANVTFLFATIGVEYLAGGLASAAFVAYLSVLCNTAYTGTQYALFTSLMSFGRTGLSASSGWVASQTSWAMFFVLSTVVALPGVALAWWMTRYLPLGQQVAREDMADEPGTELN